MKRKPYIMGFDTEDDGAGNPNMFAFVFADGQFSCETREEALEWLLIKAAEMRKRGFVVEAWATNLEYDLVNLFGSERISTVKLIFGKSYLVGAEWKRRNVIFRDTVRHVPISVAEWGKIVGLPKLEGDLFTGKRKITRALLKRRCLRDTAITYRAAKYLHDFYGEFKIKPRMTLASTALTIWRDKFWKQGISFPEEWIVENAREAYYGGRTEPFAIGTFENVAVIDAASMFPWAMVNDPLPLPWGLYERINKGGYVAPHGIYHCRCKYSGTLPLLPYRTANGLIYPCGEWSAYYTGEEIEYSREIGYEIEVISGVRFLEQCSPFDEYISTMFEKKNASRGNSRMGYKFLMNALYGKFAQRGDKIETLPLADFLNLQFQPEDFRVWNGIVIYEITEPPPVWGNVVWPAFITARARMRLHKEMNLVRSRGGLLLYCDTDSVIFGQREYVVGRMVYPVKASKPGDFESRGNYAKAIIRGKKEYGLQDEKGEWDFAVKGVPFHARESYLRTGTATYEKPIRIKESTRRNIEANRWVSVTKTRHVTYKQRRRNLDGTLAPIVILTNGDLNQDKRG